MDESLNEFKDRHALLLTEIKRLEDETTDDGGQARTRELKSILKVVARSYLRENVDPQVSEEQLQYWLGRLVAA
ncbi:MAG: hypothetical protein M3010_05965 [Candidatus Dormibacteraeota bacterium]|nr:hypothetical protein [Candidatus Dormibacteraeota bacterium]